MWIKTNKKTLSLAFFNASGRKAAHLLPGDQDVTQTAGGGQTGCGKRKANIDSKASRTQPPSGSLVQGPLPCGDPVWRALVLNTEQRKEDSDTFSEKERTGSGHEC